MDGAKLIQRLSRKSYMVDESDDDMDEVEEPSQQNVYEEEEAEIVESDVELEGETVEHDNDPPQKMGDFVLSRLWMKIVKLLKSRRGRPWKPSLKSVTPGGMPGNIDYIKILNDPELMSAFKYPEVMAALPDGQVIKRWDEGIKTMKKGEEVVFTIPPELAFGKFGSPQTIPPNATLQFEVELLFWSSVKDICKDGGIFKKISTEGEN